LIRAVLSAVSQRGGSSLPDLAQDEAARSARVRKPIILERWAVVSQIFLVALAFLTLGISIWTVQSTPAFRELFNPQPIVEAQVVESDNAYQLRLMLSNRGVTSAAIRRAWLHVHGNTESPAQMQLLLQDKDRFLPPGHMVLAMATTDQGLIPSLVEVSSSSASATQSLKCEVLLDVTRPDGDSMQARAPFPCQYASFARKPPR